MYEVYLCAHDSSLARADVFRLPGPQSDMVQCDVWCLHLLRVLEYTQEHGCPHLFRAVCSLPWWHRLGTLTLQSPLASSTNLDSWQLNQLRTMKAGGNQSATDFFNKHGGAVLLSDSDVKKKYSSRVAELYKEELAKRVKEDASR